MLNVNIVDKERFMIYPNPATDSVSIAFPTGYDNATIYLYNTMGQLILSRELTSESKSVALSGFSSGMYLYKIESASASQSGKITIQ